MLQIIYNLSSFFSEIQNSYLYSANNGLNWHICYVKSLDWLSVFYIEKMNTVEVIPIIEIPPNKWCFGLFMLYFMYMEDLFYFHNSDRATSQIRLSKQCFFRLCFILCLILRHTDTQIFSVSNSISIGFLHYLHRFS